MQGTSSACVMGVWMSVGIQGVCVYGSQASAQFPAIVAVALAFDGGVVDPDGLSTSELTTFHRDRALERMQSLMDGRIMPVYGGCVPAIAVDRLASEMDLSPEQKLALWRSYHVYVDRVAEPLRKAEQLYFYSEGGRYKAAFPEMLPGADLSHLEPVVADRFRAFQSRYERSVGASRQSLDRWRVGDETWQGDWIIAYQMGRDIGNLGGEFQRTARQISSESWSSFLEADFGIEGPAREAFVGAIPEMMSERQREIWEEHAQHSFSLNSFIGNRMTVAYRRDSSGFHAMVHLNDRVDPWAIIDEATADGAELSLWTGVLRLDSDSQVACDVTKELRRIWSNTVRALAELARDSDRDRGWLNDARINASTGETLSNRGTVEMGRRDRKFHHALQGWLIAMSAELHRHLAPEDVEVFQDRLRAQRFEGLYKSDTVDTIVDVLQLIAAEDGEDSPLGSAVFEAVQQRTEEHFLERKRLRREIADHRYRMRMEIPNAFSDPARQPWLQLRRLLVKLMESEVDTSQAVLDLIDDQSVTDILEIKIAQHERVHWLKSELFRLKQFLADL